METAIVFYPALSESITHSLFRLLSNIGYFGLISGNFMLICSLERTLSTSLLPLEKSCLHEVKHKAAAVSNGTAEDLLLLHLSP